MNIIFDKNCTQFVYEAFAEKHIMRCAICEHLIESTQFGGAVMADGSLKFTHDNIVCLLGFSEYLPKEDIEI